MYWITFFAQKFNQEEGRNEIKILLNKLLKKSKMQKKIKLRFVFILKNANN